MEIKAFQQLMKDLYYPNDAERGISRTALWLGEEFGELFAELKKHPDSYNHKAIGEEMADILAWIASLANLLKIDLESAIQEKYALCCPRCQQNPCQCTKNLP